MLFSRDFLSPMRCIFLKIIIPFILLFSTGQYIYAQNHDAKKDCYYLKEIQIDGNRKTRKEIIVRELNVTVGNCIIKDSLEELKNSNRYRLMTIQLFNDVKISWLPLNDDTATMLIQVYERFPIMPEPKLEFADRNFNVWWSEQHRDLKRINIGLALLHRNFRGNREQISVLGQIGYTQKLGVSYERPFIDKAQTQGVGISFYAMQNREIPYITDSNKLQFYRSYSHPMQRETDLSVWYTYRPRYASTHKISVLYQHYWISDTIAQKNKDYFGNNATEEDVVNIAYQYRYNAVDNWEYPLKGLRFVGTFTNKYAFRNKNFQSTLYTQLDKYWNPWRKWYVSTIVRGKLSLPQSQPYIFRRNLGYDYDYVRGYEYYVIDGTAFALLRANVKRELLNIQLRLPIRYFQVIPIRVYGKVFADAGRSYNSKPYNDFLYNKMLYSGGLGVDIVTLYDIKLRFEYTFNALGENDLFLHKNGE